MVIRLLAITALTIANVWAVASEGSIQGQWSNDARNLPRAGDFSRSLTLPSPDGRITLRVDDWRLLVTGDTPLSRKELGVETLSEILWAPDSSAFAVTSSDGGLIGTWSVAIYRIRDGAIIDPAEIALPAFEREFPKCPNNYPNIGAVAWLNGSKHLRLIAEMPCHSTCRDMCKFRGYVVDATTGRILQRLSQSEVRKRWTPGDRFSGR